MNGDEVEVVHHENKSNGHGGHGSGPVSLHFVELVMLLLFSWIWEMLWSTKLFILSNSLWDAFLTLLLIFVSGLFLLLMHVSLKIIFSVFLVFFVVDFYDFEFHVKWFKLLHTILRLQSCLMCYGPWCSVTPSH